MMSRRRALLINTASNTSEKPYNIRIIGSLLIHQTTHSEQMYTAWYVGDEFTVDTDSGLITLTDGYIFYLRYSSSHLFNTHMAGNYCILNETSGNTMYYFPSDCAISCNYDESTGLYTIVANGQIREFTPILTSTNNSEA